MFVITAMLHSGIGSNRVELAEVNQLFKQQVTLFDARVHDDSLPPPLRRAHSVGPGIGLSDDVDWSAVEAQRGDRNGAGSSAGGSSETTVTTAISGQKNKDREVATNLAKSVGKAAAKAGTAMLPPTLLREIANTRPPKDGSSKPRRPGPGPVTTSSNGTVSGPPASTSSWPVSSPPSSSTRSSTSSSPSSGPSAARRARSDPPPVYEPVESPQSPSRSRASPLASPAAVAGASDGYFGARRDESGSSPPPPTTRTDGPILPAQSRTAAGPHNRSILHHVPRSNSRVAAESAEAQLSQVVRFDRQDIPTAAPTTSDGTQEGTLQRPRGSSATNLSALSSWPVSPQSPPPPPPPSQPQISPSATSSPSHSRRSSADATQTLDAVIAGDKGKGKGRLSGPTSPGMSSKKAAGLKNLLGGLRKEEAQNTSKGSGPSATTPRRSIDAGSSGLNAAHVPPQLNAPPCDWREFKKGTYTYSVSLPLPANLPPTLYADFGRNTYSLKAVVKRSGPLTPNLSCEQEVVMVHAPDEEGSEEAEAIIVERSWEESLTYRVFVSGRSFACGSKIPLWIKFIPLGEKVRLWRLTAVLEEKTKYFAKGRKVSRHETPRRWVLIRIVSPEGKPLVPIISDQPDALRSSPLAEHAIAAAGFRLPEGARSLQLQNGSISGQSGAQASASSSSGATTSAASGSRLGAAATNTGVSPAAAHEEEDDGADEADEEALASLMDPSGPWELSMDLPVPGAGSRMNLSTDHAKSSITVHHTLRLTFRVEKVGASASGGESGTEAGKPKLFDIVIECPVTVNHSRTADSWLSLPNYWAVAGDGGAVLAPENEMRGRTGVTHGQTGTSQTPSVVQGIGSPARSPTSMSPPHTQAPPNGSGPLPSQGVGASAEVRRDDALARSTASQWMQLSVADRSLPATSTPSSASSHGQASTASSGQQAAVGTGGSGAGAIANDIGSELNGNTTTTEARQRTELPPPYTTQSMPAV